MSSRTSGRQTLKLQKVKMDLCTTTKTSNTSLFYPLYESFLCNTCVIRESFTFDTL